MTSTVLRVGTRTSPLAMWQAEHVRDALQADSPDARVELVGITTTGDVDERPLQEIGGRGVFATEIEAALARGEIDAAVHSAKDLRLELPEGLELAAFLPRHDARDVLCGPGVDSLGSLRQGATVATSSMRRRAALVAARDDLMPVDIRGNVQTRLQRTRERGHDACMLAAAGLLRLGLREEVGCFLDVAQFVPEAGQGSIVVQVRSGDEAHWSSLDDAPTRWDVQVERSVSAALGGGCEVPLGVHVQRLEDGGALGHVFLGAEGATPLFLQCELDPHGSGEEAAELLLAAVREAGQPVGDFPGTV